MKTTENQRKRIIENIFDIICETQFKDEAIKQMRKDLKNKNISFNGKDNITIENASGQIIQYTISIK